LIKDRSNTFPDWTPVATSSLLSKLSVKRLPRRSPDRSTLSRWLKRATQQGLICCSGSGYRGDRFRYWLPGHEPLLWPGDRASEEEKQAWRERRAAHVRGLGDGWAGK
jgi:hypothetical protein